jgi:hypothetical protein
MTRSLTIGTASGNKEPTEIWVGTASGNKQITEGWVGTASGNKQFFPPLAVLTASASPSSQAWSGSLGSYTTTSNLTCTAGGGSGNYTYAWEQSGGSGSISFDDATAATTGGTSVSNDQVTVRCLVSDDAGSTPVYSNEITVG